MNPSPAMEREAKLRVEAPDALERIEAAGCPCLLPRHLEENWVLDTPSRRLDGGGRLLRLRRAAGGWTLTLKGPARTEAGHKLREETETGVEDGEILLQALGAAGLEVAWRYEKYRSLFRLGEVRIALDETPLGDYLELEGPAGATEEAARRLGYDPADFLARTYAEIWREEGGGRPFLFREEAP